MPSGTRPPISENIRAQIFRRDGWLCRYCGAPVILAQAMKYLERFARDSGITEPLAYYHLNWTRTTAPLLDHIGATADHVKAHSRGGTGEVDNYVTCCWKCNSRKNDAEAEPFSERSPRRKVKAKYGEPLHWDGLSSLFMVLYERDHKSASTSDIAWFRALKAAHKKPE